MKKKYISSFGPFTCSANAIENKINLTFFSSEKSRRRVLHTGLAKVGIKELICEAVASSVFLLHI